jgi:hypothetical protein
MVSDFATSHIQLQNRAEKNRETEGREFSVNKPGVGSENENQESVQP